MRRRERDPVSLDLLIEGAAGDAQPAGGALDVAALGAQDKFDVPPLRLFERRVHVCWSGAGFGGHQGRVEPQVVRQQAGH